MSHATYQRQTDFISQVIGSMVNAEFDRLGVAVKSHADDLDLLQRDDGELEDNIVKLHAMHGEVKDWVEEIAQQAAADPDALRNQVNAAVLAKLTELGVLAEMLNGSAIDFLSFEIVDNDLIANYKGVLNPNDIRINSQGILEVDLNG
ncbi:hypothetical protein [Thiothrix sp.]|jgi:hypothetical protein|uniref:hypothetical protein n=1 Tax=Thiothrix sp. TaxID=1032 RepID=UPI00257F4F5D|nr:hypothetical protein [Thiothrix sp.]